VEFRGTSHEIGILFRRELEHFLRRAVRAVAG
jgi:hypothetical protein